MAGAGVLALALGIAWWSADSTEPAPSGASAPEPVASSAQAQAQAQLQEQARATQRTLETPKSLEGSDPDGAIGWNPDGTVRVDRPLRQRFDHLLSALGEVTLEMIRTRLQADLLRVASAAATASVLQAFDRYTDYLAAVDRLMPAPAAQRLVAVHELRFAKLGEPMARAFFEEEERADALSLERQALARRTDVSDEARRAAMAELDAKRSPEERVLLEQTTQLQATVAETAAFEAAGASREARQAARTARLGAEAAQRLGALDDERARWQARLESFRQARAAIQAEAAGDEAQRRIDELLERDFSEPERRRVRALVP